MGSDGVPLLAVTIPLAGVVGVFVGSFLNVVIYRTPLGLSVSTPRSFCPTCRRQLRWWENLPFVSWVALGGRCRTCRQPISARYPLVELTTGIVFALVTWGWHGTVVSAAYCSLAASMIAVGMIEWGGERSPLSVAAIGTAVGLLIIVVGAGWEGHWRIVSGSLLGTAIAVLIVTILRSTDPECLDPRAHGRSALLVAGCWVGGLGLGPAGVGAAVWIISYFLCMAATWSVTRRRPGGGTGATRERPIHPLIGTPLVTALAIAMAASLIAGG
jgi:leader peptidase (prepilin peptidase) / N-methyltransferase